MSLEYFFLIVEKFYYLILSTFRKVQFKGFYRGAELIYFLTYYKFQKGLLLFTNPWYSVSIGKFLFKKLQLSVLHTFDHFLLKHLSTCVGHVIPMKTRWNKSKTNPKLWVPLKNRATVSKPTIVSFPSGLFSKFLNTP